MFLPFGLFILVCCQYKRGVEGEWGPEWVGQGREKDKQREKRWTKIKGETISYGS